jgi:hypothetical protein
MISINVPPEFGWPHAVRTDVMFFQRPMNADHVKAMELSKKSGLPVWVDYDDDLFTLPPSNPGFDTYGRDDTREAIKRCLAMADCVTVTTEALKSAYKAYSEKIEIIPNALPSMMLGKRKLKPRAPVVAWRGGTSHEEDLESVGQQLVETAFEKPEWGWLFVGNPTWRVVRKMPAKRAVHVPGMDQLSYIEYLSNIPASVWVVPLADNTFNRSKSNIAWIEATWAGAAVIAPDWPEWKRPGVINYKDPDDFKRVLKETMGRAEKGPMIEVSDSLKHIRDNLTLPAVNEKRLQILHSLFTKS